MEKRNLLCLPSGFHRRVRLLSPYDELSGASVLPDVVRELCRIVRIGGPNPFQRLL